MWCILTHFVNFCCIRYAIYIIKTEQSNIVEIDFWFPSFVLHSLSNQHGLEAAVDATALTAEFLNKSMRPVKVGGPNLQGDKVCKAFLELADAMAVMSDANGKMTCA
ncbi:hypothetical protein IFM89_022593 [Coptis chinensis]|uniref:Uncharacterized protein n=1 Tax=Coptis chinensis TaxID=261450 RepID=A0A835M961_9MAGN|nr:hypothetical protein IFM89_022593 [Coptis chinensis]